MTENYYFPFGKKLQKVEQKEKTPKEAFVFGVYASAVHARWTDYNGKQKVSAFAVASEPEIFWTGKNAEEIIKEIKIPEELGKLSAPKDIRLNGPSGRALDELYLKPLGLNRENTWLCDLLPESRVNENQFKAISEHYTPELIGKYNLKPATIPLFDKNELNSKERCETILQELEMSKAKRLILLGDLPIYWFLRLFAKKYSKLSQFGETIDTYGIEHEIKINNIAYKVIPLCHPRQANRLGSSSSKWGKLHDYWINKKSEQNANIV
jgi:uracil-DNA glycosylase